MATTYTAQPASVRSDTLSDGARGRARQLSRPGQQQQPRCLLSCDAKALWHTYRGPRIRQTLQIGKQVAQWYSGYDQLLNSRRGPIQRTLCWDPKMCVSCRLSCRYQEILNNEGDAQLMDVLDSYMAAAERSLEDTMRCRGSTVMARPTAASRLTGLTARLVLIIANAGVYGGIDRATAARSGSTTAFDRDYRPTRWVLSHDLRSARRSRSTTIRPMLNYIMTKQSPRSRLRRPADHVARTLRGLRRGHRRDPTADQSRPRWAS